MQITKIKALSNNRYELIIDDAKIIIYGDALIDNNLLKKREITKDEYHQLMSSNNFYEGYFQIIKYLTYKMRSIKEVKQKLNTLHISIDNQNKIINRLTKERYLDNEKYINSFINDELKLTFNGPKKILLRLKQKGFIEKDIKYYIDNIDNQIFYDKVQKVIQKKLKTNKDSKRLFNLKIKKYLYDLGYEDKYIIDIDFDDQDNFNKVYNKYYEMYSKKYDIDQVYSLLKNKLYSLGYTEENFNKKTMD